MDIFIISGIIVVALLIAVVRTLSAPAAQGSSSPALNPCKDCGKEISVNAKACPHCGAPTRPRTSTGTWAVAIILGLIIWGWLSSAMDSIRTQSDGAAATAASSPSPARRQLDKSAAMQKGRSKLIAGFRSEGIFTDIESASNGMVRVTVGPPFYALDFKDKQSLLGVVYAFYFDGNNDLDLITLYDSKTDKWVGRFSTIAGLELD